MKLKKEEQIKPKASTRREIIKIRGKIKITGNQLRKINTTPNWFFEKTKEIEKGLYTS